MIACHETMPIIDVASTKMTNTTATIVTKTSSINCHSKKVRDCHIMHKVSSAIKLLLTISIAINLLSLCKTKKH